MDGFYAGKPGVSFVLKGRFNYISPEKDSYRAALRDLEEEGYETAEAVRKLKPLTMTECLKDVNYKEVWYNEYCIIDTINKLDKDNGKVFRRTLRNPSDETLIGGVCEYVGQIVGPPGPVSLIEIGDTDSIHESWQNVPIDSQDFIEYRDRDGNRRNDRPLGVDLKVYETGEAGAMKLVPGSVYEDTSTRGQYIDNIKYNWYQFVDGDATDEEMPSRIYIGFDIPAYTAHFEGGRALNYKQNPSVTEVEETQNLHFYNKYKIDIPRGITGANFRDFARITVEASDTIYSALGILYDADNDTYDFDNSYIVTNLTDKDIWVCYFYWYDKNGNENKLNYPIYVGTIKDIKRISPVSADGSFTVYYTNGESQTFEEALSWITEVNIDAHRNLSFTGNNDNIVLPDPVNLNTIVDVKLQGDVNRNNFTNDNRIKIRYSSNLDEETVIYEAIGDDINYIQDTFYYYPEAGIPEGITRVEPFHLYILFNAKTKRYPDIGGEDGVDLQGRKWKVIKPDLGVYWLDLGPMRQVDQGVILQGYYELDVESDQEAIEWLTEEWPNGLEGENAGKLIGIQLNSGDVYLMAYDYDHNRWFNIGGLQKSVSDAIINDPEVIDSGLRGHVTTAWFNLEEDKETPSPMSTPWKYEGLSEVEDGEVIKLSFITEDEGSDMVDDIWTEDSAQEGD